MIHIHLQIHIPMLKIYRTQGNFDVKKISLIRQMFISALKSTGFAYNILIFVSILFVKSAEV